MKLSGPTGKTEAGRGVGSSESICGGALLELRQLARSQEIFVANDFLHLQQDVDRDLAERCQNSDP